MMTALPALLGDELPLVLQAVPSAKSQAYCELLAQSECPALTARRKRRAEASGTPQDPIVYESAKGSVVRDVDGNIYLDLTAGFGAALLGHSNARVVEAVQAQSARMLHALGDVYPSAVKIEFEQALTESAPWPDAKVILGLSGADAVEAALKTAVLATKRSGVVAFAGAYHGLSHGPLAACGYSAKFREPFAGQLNANVRFVPYPDEDQQTAQEQCLEALKAALSDPSIGALLVEPILGRGGVRVGSRAVFSEMCAMAQRAGVVVIADEIYTGLYRTSDERAYSSCWTHSPDIILWGKSLGGGVPVSACVVKDQVAQAWGNPDGEALHTSTFLGNPLACAAGLAVHSQLSDPEVRQTIREKAAKFWTVVVGGLVNNPRCRVVRARGRGLLVGLELEGGWPRVLSVMRELLQRGYIVLPGGTQGDQLVLTPPATLTDDQLQHCAMTLAAVLRLS